MPHVHVHLFFQEAYTFWICSTHLPMWLLNSDNKNSVKVEACQSACLTVEKQCPFLIKGTEDDMASGNPSFMCKGKTHSKNSWNWCMIQNIAVCASGAQRAKFAKKVHKPPLWVNIINFELNWFNASIWVPCNPSDPKKSWLVFKFITKKLHFYTYSSISLKSLHRIAWLFWCRLKLWVPKWNAEDMCKIQNLA